MKVILEIPTAFVEEFNVNRFSETFERVQADIKSYREEQRGYYGFSGNYEDETIEMLKKAFEKAERIDFQRVQRVGSVAFNVWEKENANDKEKEV